MLPESNRTRNITQLRASPEHDEWFQQFEDLCLKKEDIKLVVEALREQPDYVTSESELDTALSRMGERRMKAALGLLIEPNKWIRPIVTTDTSGEQSNIKYWLVHKLGRRDTFAS